MRTMRMEREDIENSLKVLSHIVDDDFIITVDEARKIIRIDGETIEALQAQLPKRGEWIQIDKHTVQCSLCRRYLDLRGVNAGRGDANYCPKCGAKMEAQE